MASEEELKHFAEEMGIYFEEQGGPRMAGRILGWLLVCEPPVQSSAELVEVLGASKGSVSSMTRLLMQGGLIERVAVAGERGSHFRAADNVPERFYKQSINKMRTFRQMAERGLSLLDAEPPRRRSRLQALHDLYAFLEDELPSVLDRYRDRVSKESPSNLPSRGRKGRKEK